MEAEELNKFVLLVLTAIACPLLLPLVIERDGDAIAH